MCLPMFAMYLNDDVELVLRWHENEKLDGFESENWLTWLEGILILR
jgi:hypothetical protein